MGAFTWPIWAMRIAFPAIRRSRPQRHAAQALGRILDRLRLDAVHQNGGDGGARSAGLGDVERQRLPLAPARNRGMGGARKQAWRRNTLSSPSSRIMSECCAQREQQVLGRRAAILHVVLRPLAERPVPVERPQPGRLVRRMRLVVRQHEGEPRGAISPFCEADIATSMPQASISNGMHGDRGDPVHHEKRGMPGRIDRPADRSDVFATPEAVSTCTMRTALMVWSLSRRSRSSTAAGSTAARQDPPGRTSMSTPINAAISPQPSANRPLSSTRILSPRDNTL